LVAYIFRRKTLEGAERTMEKLCAKLEVVTHKEIHYSPTDEDYEQWKQKIIEERKGEGKKPAVILDYQELIL